MTQNLVTTLGVSVVVTVSLQLEQGNIGQQVVGVPAVRRGYSLETPFVVPWGWVTVGVILCLLTSLASGYYPARLAAKLDPIVALGRE